MTFERWTTTRDRSTSWHAACRIRRLQVGYHVHRHSGHLPDRWVFQPWLTFDRRTHRNPSPVLEAVNPKPRRAESSNA